MADKEDKEDILVTVCMAASLVGKSENGKRWMVNRFGAAPVSGLPLDVAHVLVIVREMREAGLVVADKPYGVLRNMCVIEIEAALEALQPMRDEVKRRAMIFDCEEKERIAIEQGFKLDHYHQTSFKSWIMIKDRHTKKVLKQREKQEKAANK